MKLSELLKKVTPLPWKLDGNHVTDSGPNSIAVTAEGWSDDQPNAQYMVHAANVLPQLIEAVKEYTKERAYQSVEACKKDQDRLEKELLKALDRAETLEA